MQKARIMQLAKDIAHLSPCTRRKVGAVLVASDGAIICMGYNTTPGDRECGVCYREGKPHGKWTEDEQCPVKHAEEMIFEKVQRYKIDIRGTTIYLTYPPCNRCAKKIVKAGIGKVVYIDAHDNEEEVLEILQQGNVEVVNMRKQYRITSDPPAGRELWHAVEFRDTENKALACAQKKIDDGSPIAQVWRWDEKEGWVNIETLVLQ